MKILLQLALVVASVCICQTRAHAADVDAAALADDAVAAHFHVEKLTYEKQTADRTIKGSEANIQQSMKTIPMLREKVEKLQADLAAAREEAARLVAAADEAKKQAAAPDGAEKDKTAAAEADKARMAAEQKVRQLDNDVRRDSDQLKRNEDRIKQMEADIAAAKKRIPELEMEITVARQKSDELKSQSAAADAQSAAAQAPQTVARKIDELIDARLQSLTIPASPQIDDATFLRRVTLDIIGAVPKYADVLPFLDDTSPTKRAAIVDRLLSEYAYGRNFAQRFCTVTTENGTSTLTQGKELFRNWLSESIHANRRWDRTVRDMLSADGRGYEQPAALFTVAYRMNEQPDPALLLSAAGDYFLGLQIQCAQCHDHPHFEWKHTEFWQMAALFGRVRMKGNTQIGRELEYLLTDDDVEFKEMLRTQGVKYPDQLISGKIGIPDPVNAGEILETVSARFLDSQEPTLTEKGNHRGAFADWVTAKSNPYFARATVNRIWCHFFGRGIVEPILNLHPDNKPAHPDVLELLTKEFIDCNYDLKHLVRCIVHTTAYQRSCQRVPGNEQDDRHFSHMAVKPLDSYVLIDSLAAVLKRTQTDNNRRRDDALVFDTRLPGGDPVKYTHSIPQVLRLMNAREHADVNGPTQSYTGGKQPPEAIEHLYLAVLARRPSAEEKDELLQYVASQSNPRQGMADVFWVLLNSAEFLVNH